MSVDYCIINLAVRVRVLNADREGDEGEGLAREEGGLCGDVGLVGEEIGLGGGDGVDMGFGGGEVG